MTPRRPGRSLALLAATAALLLAARLAPVGPAGASAQEPARTPPATSGPDGKAPTQTVGNLTARYRIQQRFSPLGEKAQAGSIGQFQAAFRESVSETAASGKELTRTVQAIFSERPVRIDPTDDRVVVDSIRHYKSVTITPDPWKDRKDRRPLEDLTIWYRTGQSDVPLVMVMTPDRPLRDEEYRFALSYDFAANFALLLPETPLRIGDAYRLPLTGASALVNDEVREGALTGKFAEVRAHPKFADMQVAIVNVTGRVATASNRDVRDVAVNARIEFAFKPAPGGESLIDASGSIEKLLLAQVATLRVPGQAGGGRPRRRDLNFEQKVPGGDPILAVPKPVPDPTPENSWLTYTERDGHYHFRHPQRFQPDFSAGLANVVDLVRVRPAEREEDRVRVSYEERPKTKPQDSFNQMVDQWRKNGVEVQLGRSERLPEADWPGMAVHHMEAVLTDSEVPPRVPRRFFDAYVLQFPRNVSLFITATTFQDQPDDFRAQVRDMLKTVKLGAPKAQ